MVIEWFITSETVVVNASAMVKNSREWLDSGRQCFNDSEWWLVYWSHSGEASWFTTNENQHAFMMVNVYPCVLQLRTWMFRVLALDMDLYPRNIQALAFGISHQPTCSATTWMALCRSRNPNTWDPLLHGSWNNCTTSRTHWDTAAVIGSGDASPVGLWLIIWLMVWNGYLVNHLGSSWESFTLSMVNHYEDYKNVMITYDYRVILVVWFCGRCWRLWLWTSYC